MSPVRERASSITASAPRIRLRALAVAGACIALGLLAQLGRTFLLDIAGSVLYVAVIGMLVVIVRPWSPAPVVAVTALAVAAGVELLQLTALPALAAEAVPGAALVLGNAFDPVDLVAYAAAGMLLLVVHPLLVRSVPSTPPAASQPRALP